MLSSEIPLNEPPELRLGTTWKWRREDLVTDYPASAWTLKYYLKQFAAAGAHVELTASADGDNFAISVSAATTQGYTAGRYSWAAEVSGGSSEVYEIDRGTFVLLPRYDQAAAYDDRSHARKMLEAIEAVLESRATADVLEYTIGSRHLKKMSPKELTDWRDYYRAELAGEKALERVRNGQGTGRIVFGFGRRSG